MNKGREQMMAKLAMRNNTPGQIPGKTLPPSLTSMPTPLTPARMLAHTGPMLRPQAITDNLGMTREQEQSFQRFVSSLQDSANEAELRSQLFQFMHYGDGGYDPALRSALTQRTLNYYKHTGRSQANGLRVARRAQGLRKGKTAMTEQLTILEKAQPRGGNYHRRVAKEGGGFHYYYDEDKYASRKDAHLSGSDAKKTNCRSAVDQRLGTGVGLKLVALKDLVGKYEDTMIAEVVRQGVTSGRYNHKDGVLRMSVQKSEATERFHLRAAASADASPTTFGEGEGNNGTPTNEERRRHEDAAETERVKRLHKGGEGSRGGNIMGHTASGKPIYGRKDHHSSESKAARKEYAPTDHRDAAAAHRKAGDDEMRHGKGNFTVYEAHEGIAEHHEALAAEKEKPATPEKEKPGKYGRNPFTGQDYKSPDIGKRFSKSLAELFPNQFQKAEGSRGGNIVGHTKSGKPVYGGKKGADTQSHVDAHKGFGAADHQEAAALHAKQQSAHMREGNDDRAQHHAAIAETHRDEAAEAFRRKYTGR